MTAGEAQPMRYSWASRDEWMLTQRGKSGLHLILIQPLFGELNRTRRLLRDVMRRLADQDIGTSLPDLPGTGESSRPLADCSWSDWTGALAAAAETAAADNGGAVLHLASIRGGALLDGAVEAASCWRLAPVSGAVLLRDLFRTQALGDPEADPSEGDEPVELAGYRLSPDLIAALGAAAPAPAMPLRTIRLEGDTAVANATLAGPALWRRAEPGGSRELAEAIAADLAAWVTRCEA